MKSTVEISTPLRFTAEIRGRRALHVLKHAGVPRLFDYRPAFGGDPCWTFPRARIGDVLAAAETMRGVAVALQHEQESLLP